MQARSTDFSTVARLLAISGGHANQAAFLAESTKASESVRMVLRAAADAGGTSNPAFAAALADSGIVSAFVEALRSRSVFARLLDGGMIRLPLRTSAAIVSANASGWITGESLPIPVSTMALAGATLEERRAAALIVVTSELLRSAAPAGRALLDNSLRGAVADAIDAAFLDVIADGITPVVASGVTAPDALADLRKLLNAVNTVGNGALFFVASPDVANAACTLSGAGGLVFPGMSPTGGEMLGVATVVSSAVLSGTLMLVDVSGIAGEIESVSVSQSDAATIQFSTAPDSPPNASTVAQSLWQTNRVGLLATAWLGAEKVRPNAVAVLAGVEWGGA